jgi:hypothetical protein
MTGVLGLTSDGKEYVPNPGGPSCAPGDREECCSFFGHLDYLFCLAFCVFCCMECDLGKIVQGAPQFPKAKPQPALPRDYDDFNVINGTIGFTTSEYGKFIPIVFGSDKLTGNVIWSSGFETKQFTSGDTIYQYQTVSFALGVCEGEIDAVLRMWLGDALMFDKTAEVDVNGIIQPNADGFVMGMTLDLVSADSPLKDLADGQRLTKISVFNGGETQLPEGIIVAAEGYAETPAYRGLAYVLFENMVVTEAIPNIFVEVLANVNAIYPRLYGNLPAPQQYFDELRGQFLYHDPGYDQIIVSAFDDSGSGTIPDGAGFAIFDGNRLDPISQRELAVTEGIDDFGTIDPPQLFVLANGNWLIFRNTGLGGAQGEVLVYNPTISARISTLGPAGNASDHDFPNGFGLLTRVSGALFYPVLNKPPVNVFYGVHNQGHVGWALVGDDGVLSMVSSQDNVLSSGTGSSCNVIYASTFITAHPTFADGAVTDGAHVYFFVNDGSPFNDKQFHIVRATIGGAGTPTDPLYTSLGSISFNQFNGEEYGHRLNKVMMDDADGCLVLFVKQARADWIAKWSPFTGAFLWKSIVPGGLWGPVPQSGATAILWGDGYWFIGNDQHIHFIDLATGIITDKGSLGSQVLPAAEEENQFYNGFENSLVYRAADGTNQLIKVFLDRIARANVPLADIVSILLKRVGVLETEINIDDLTALSLVGYTINERKSLRNIFAELGQVFRFDIVESNGKIIYKTRGSNPVATIPKEDFADVDDEGWLLRHQEKDFVPTRKINLTYRDIDREYGTNVQNVLLPNYEGTRYDEDAAIDVNVPVVLEAADAKTLSEILLYSKIVYQSTFEVQVAPKHIVLDPGDVVSLEMSDTESITARVRDMTIGNDREIKLSLSQEDPDIYNDQAELFGIVGRFSRVTLPSLDPRVDPLFMIIPFRTDAEAASTTTQYKMYLTFLNTRVTTPSEETITVTVNGETVAVPPPVRFPTWGRVVTPLQGRSSTFSTDFVSEMTIQLVSDSGATLASAPSLADLINNGSMNLAYVGGELIQFLDVVDEGNDRYTLTTFNRGRFGTEGRSFAHKAGEEFVLLADDAGLIDAFGIIPINLNLGDSPLKIYQVFLNTNNPFQPAPIRMLPATNLRPWAVASFTGEYVGNDLELQWQRRTRWDGQWIDDGDFEVVSLNELTETYDLYLYTNPVTFSFNDPATYLRKVTVTSPTYTYTDAMQTADGFNRTTTDIYVFINQNGSFSGQDPGAAISRRVEYKR